LNFLLFLLTMLVALVFGYLGMRLKLPAGALIGSVVGVIALNLLYGQSYFYPEMKIVLQILTGAMVGSRVGKQDVLELKTIIWPTLLLLLGMVLLNITFGALIYRFSSLDAATALFATAPGGMADMALISSDFGANTSYVGILQMFRVLVIFIFMPPIFRRIMKKRGEQAPAACSNVPAVSDPSSPAPSRNPKDLILMVFCAAAGGLLLRFLGVTAGELTGGMVASAAYCIARGKVYFPGVLKFILQVLSGTFIGVGITRQTVQTLPQLGVALAVMFVGIFAFVFIMAFLMRRLFRVDIAVCLLASTPGGIQEMALLSEDLGADTPKVAIMHTVRLMFVILTFPTMISLLIALFNGG
jgi:membrane AbrB-like protein